MGNKSSRYLGVVCQIVRKDLATEWRSRQLLSAMLVFALLVILIFNFALELNARARIEVTAGVLWTTFVFAGTLGLNRSFAIEKEREALDGLLLAPVERGAIYFGKLLSNLVFMLIVEAATLPIYGLLYNVNVANVGVLFVILIGSVGYVAIGTLLTSMTVQARTRDLLLPVLLFPLIIPLLVAALRASSSFLEGLEMQYIWPSLNLIMAYDIIMLALGYMFFDYVIEE
ncbi:MAG: heme exporter protein CcmB [Chloroflexi bacterium]|nr:heme exporter protein CcmB [Chloroflexota bacterium]